MPFGQPASCFYIKSIEYLFTALPSAVSLEMRLSLSTDVLSKPGALLLVFCVLLGPFALDFHLHYPDEIYYRDAAVKMLQTGDYLNTYLGSGELRFKKPILTYWAVVAGFKLFGIHAFGSRIFFLLAGAATVGLTYLMGKFLFQDRKIAGLAALLLASNPILLFASSRSIPDVLLVLTLTGSALGVVGLLREGEQAKRKFIWFLYLGLALAFEVKGLPAVALGGLAILYLRYNPWQPISWKKLLYLPALGVALIVSTFWFVAMWKIHGPAFLNSFLEDQVGTRVTSRVLLIVQNGALAAVLLAGMFLPWLVLAFPKGKEVLVKIWKENPQFFAFALLWGLAILGMGALTSKFYERYLLPVAPVVGLWLAWFLVRGRALERSVALKRVAAVLLSLLLLLCCATAWVGMVTDPGAASLLYPVLGLLFLGFAAWVWKRSPQHLPQVTAVSVLLLFFLLTGITRLISLPHQGTQAKEVVDRLRVGRPIGFAGNLHEGSKIRMSLGTAYEVVDLSREGWKEEAKGYAYLILEDRLFSEWDTLGYTVTVASTHLDSKALPDLLLATTSRQRDEVWKMKGRVYYMLQKKDISSSSKKFY